MTRRIPKKIAMTGSSGLLGSALRKKLRSLGIDVVRLSRRKPKEGKLAGESFLEWDPLKGLADPSKIEGIDSMIHLAGASIAERRWTAEFMEQLRVSRVDATKRLCEQILSLSSPPPSFLSASAIGIYGNSGPEPIDEKGVFDSGFLGKLAEDWENASLPLTRAGIRVCWMRFGVMMSPEGGALAKVLPLFRWGLGGRLGSGKQMWSWIDLEDAVNATIELLECNECAGPYNFTAPNSISNSEWTNRLAAHLNRHAFAATPSWILRLAVGKMAQPLLLDSCNATPRRLLERGFAFQSPTFEEFLKNHLSTDRSS